MTSDEGERWKEMHGELCLVEVELRQCITSLMRTAGEPNAAVKTILWKYDLWPLPPAVSETG